MADDTNNTKTVTFDVGGKVLKVSRSLIDEHEGTMIARLVSDTWLDDPTKPVFIDRDGDIFAQVLNYLRYGDVTLPMTVSKDMFLRGMDFYGIVPEDGSVKTYSMSREVSERHEQISMLVSEQKELELINKIEFLANVCYRKCVLEHGSFTGSQHIYFCTKKDTAEEREKTKLWEAANAMSGDPKKKEAFHNCLMRYGLRLDNCEVFDRSYCFVELSLL